MARRLSAMRAKVSEAALDSIGLDETRRQFEPGSQIFAEGARNEVQLLVGGVVGDVRLLANGRRQILALRFPGELLTSDAGETLVALTRVLVADGSPFMTCLNNPEPEYQPLRRAWLAAGRCEVAILRDQVVRLGRMSAFERMAHMLLEAHERLSQVGLATDTTFHLPLTQEMVSDVIGLSVVHLNRTLQALRRGGLVSSKQNYVTLVDRAQLVEASGYVSRFPAPWQPNEAFLPRRGSALRAVAA